MTSNNANIEAEGMPLTLGSLLRNRLCVLILHRKPLWGDIRGFGSWLEFEAASIAHNEIQNTISINLDSNSAVESLRIGLKKYPHELGRFHELWVFLKSMGIDNIKLDPRLERNQIEDVISFLYYYKHRIHKHNSGHNPRGLIRHLFSSHGVHLACTQTCIQNRTLQISYSYCTLQFSNVVHWFERRDRNFRDHRTLFHAAPRYGLLAMLLFAGPSIIYAVATNQFYLLLIICLTSVMLFGLIYIFFMVVGSIEYDNEEKAYNLTKTNKQLEQYTAQIQADIGRARLVQEKFLPNVAKMPVKDRIDWASCFIPAVEVGGDYFDVKKTKEDKIAILFSDVCGHGMAAAFITAIIKTTFHTWAERGGLLEDLVRELNSNLYRLTPDDSFSAVFATLYDPSTGRLDYINGGHHPEPWLISGQKTRPICSLNKARNIILGITEDIDIIASYEVLNQGDTVLMASDGVIENQNIDGDSYGIEQFEKFLETRRDSSAEELVNSIVEEIELFSKDAKPGDDRTILAFRIDKVNQMIYPDCRQ
ncbi:MAG: PP2C family protein-serine/threonine phosphatase [Sedimentisphaerales bacterium]|nr:PP2C family protein-serine/threonine phosphatase [Sedimentisphaerales bacterium]